MARSARSAPSAPRAASERAARLRRFRASRARKVSTKTLWAKRPACRACPESTRTRQTAARASCARMTTLQKTRQAASAGRVPQDGPLSSKGASRVARVVRAQFLSPLPLPTISPAPLAILGSSRKPETYCVRSAPLDYTRPSLVMQPATLALRVGGAQASAPTISRRARTAAKVVTLLLRVRLIRAPAMPALPASRATALVQTAALCARIVHEVDHRRRE